MSAKDEPAKDARVDRLAAALRDNLKKRKARARGDAARNDRADQDEDDAAR